MHSRKISLESKITDFDSYLEFFASQRLPSQCVSRWFRKCVTGVVTRRVTRRSIVSPSLSSRRSAPLFLDVWRIFIHAHCTLTRCILLHCAAFKRFEIFVVPDREAIARDARARARERRDVQLFSVNCCYSVENQLDRRKILRKRPRGKIGDGL